VIEVAMALAGFTPAEAEGLRRATSRKRSEAAIREHHRRFVAGAAARGVPAATAERVWAQIQGFSGFGFPKAHSAAFGLLAYQSAWLRIHHAPEFLCSLLNEQPMGFYPPDSLVHEARRRGIRVAGPDANRSQVLCHVESPRRRVRIADSDADANPHDPYAFCNPLGYKRHRGSRQPSTELRGGLRVRIGLGYVKGVRAEEMERLVAERERGGPYGGIAELASRSGVGIPGLERLAWAGALDGIPLGSEDHRRQALWRVGVAAAGRGHAGGTQLALPIEPPEPPRLQPLGEWGELIADYRSTGIATGKHPLALLRPGLDPAIARSADLARTDDGATVEVAGMVVARQRPETAKGIVFLLLEDERGTVNLIVPPPVYERHRSLVRTAPLLRARGRLERREGAVNVLVVSLAALEPDQPATAPATRTAPPALCHPEGDKVQGGSRQLPPLDRPARREPPPGSPSRAELRRLAVAELRAVSRAELRRLAVAELRAVAPAGHSFGRRG
jgi:error-prone DNA polymerase